MRPFLESGAPLRDRLARLAEAGTKDAFIKRILHLLEPEQPTAAKHPPPLRQSGIASNGAAPPSEADTPAPLVEPLTNRELDIVELLADRLQSKEIAEKLCISAHTVNAHLKRIYRKLDVTSLREAVARAVQAGLPLGSWAVGGPGVIALVAVARDFVSNVLFDMWRNQRPFFLEVSDYRAYRRKRQPANN